MVRTAVDDGTVQSAEQLRRIADALEALHIPSPQVTAPPSPPPPPTTVTRAELKTRAAVAYLKANTDAQTLSSRALAQSVELSNGVGRVSHTLWAKAKKRL